ncbi:MAG: DUF4004 family protein [Acutalibacteraceae bacterium]
MAAAEEKLIAKKELLSRYGISYGALYRWKRKGLIPEEWFIRRSTVTGQETFFRESQICARIEEILALKDGSSLDELAARYKEKSAADGLALRVSTSFGSRLYRAEDGLTIAVRPDGSETDITAARSCGRRRRRAGKEGDS